MDRMPDGATQGEGAAAALDDRAGEPTPVVDRRAVLQSILGGLAVAAVGTGGALAAETSSPAAGRSSTRSSRAKRTHVRFSVGPEFVEDFLKAATYPLEVYNQDWDDPRGANPHPKAQVRHAGVAKIWTGITQMTMLIPRQDVFSVEWADGRILIEAEAQGKLHWGVWHRFVFPATSDWHLTQRGSLDYTVWPTMSLRLDYDRERRALHVVHRDRVDRERRALRPELSVEKLRWKPGLLGQFVKKRDLEALVREHLGNLELPLDMQLDIPIPTAEGQHYVTAQVADVDLTVGTSGLDMDVALDFGWRSET